MPSIDVSRIAIGGTLHSEDVRLARLRGEYRRDRAHAVRSGVLAVVSVVTVHHIVVICDGVYAARFFAEHLGHVAAMVGIHIFVG